METIQDSFHIEKFVVKNLFYKYNVTISLENDCTIIIGPNGVGKSTILRLLNAYLSANYIRLCKTPFESINIYFDEEVSSRYGFDYGDYIEITYYELLPKKEYLVEKFSSYINHQYSYNKQRDWEAESHGKKPLDVKKEIDSFEKLLDELLNQNLYGNFVLDLFYKKEPKEKVKKLIDLYSSYDLIESSDLIKDMENTMAFIFFGSKFSEGMEHQSTIGSKLFLAYGSMTYYKNRSLDLVQNYQLINNRVSESYYYNNDLEWIQNIYGHKRNAHIVSNKSEREYLFSYKYLKMSTYMPKFMKIDRLEILHEILSKDENKIYKDKNPRDNWSDKLINKKELDINQIIFENYYKEEVVEYIQKISNNYTLDYINKNITSVQDEYERIKEQDDLDISKYMHQYLKNELDILRKYFEDGVLSDYYDYVRPILPNNSMFYVDIISIFRNYDSLNKEYEDENYLTGYRDEEGFGQLITFLYYIRSFLTEVLPILKSEKAKNEKTIEFEAKLKKYMVDKYVEATPSRLKVRESNVRSKTSLFVLYDKDELDLSVISSGEKKIIMLFAIAIYLDNTVIFLDEPELSLSLGWQESLLPDLLECGNNNKFIVATHSPYIAKDDSLRRFLTFLPQKDV